MCDVVCMSLGVQVCVLEQSSVTFCMHVCLRVSIRVSVCVGVLSVTVSECVCVVVWGRVRVCESDRVYLTEVVNVCLQNFEKFCVCDFVTVCV